MCIPKGTTKQMEVYTMKKQRLTKKEYAALLEIAKKNREPLI